MGALLPLTTWFVLTIEAPAKVNLGLHVLRKRPDGYHDIDTVMVRLGWFDIIEASRHSDVSLTTSDPELPVGRENLCLRAALALSSRFGIKQGVRLHLTKSIPVGAGLGGGSSDAAATLRLLARFWGISVSTDELTELGAGLGADVPFFFGPSPAVARGIGGELTGLTGQDDSPLSIPFSFAVVKPKPSVSTAEAYRLVAPSGENRPDIIGIVKSCDLDRWRAELRNDFQIPIERFVPEIAHVRRMLLETGAGYASMSGSGSAVYGVFEDLKKAEDAARMFTEKNFVCRVCGAV